VGVQKAQISKLEKKANNVTIDTILRIFQALKTTVNFKVEMLDKKINVI
jgi:HTH-type transcriptional regulator / antitoxin HipB